MDKSTMMLMEKVQTNAKASKALSHSRFHAKEAAASQACHELFKGEAGQLEKGMATKHKQLKGLHQQISDLCLQVHHIHTGS